MKKLGLIFGIFGLCAVMSGANAYTMKSQKELGKDDAKNQNIVVNCTTRDGKISGQTCALRRYAKCTINSAGKKNCNGWQSWQDLRNPGSGSSDWRKAAEHCCQAKGLR
ncbi:MAG: hypothetical protein LBL75_04110 [Rickettsiales bacterium]|nr:hypothetical protein [Rickettsiales bacterium]